MTCFTAKWSSQRSSLKTIWKSLTLGCKAWKAERIMTASCPPSLQTKTCKAQHTPHESHPLLDATIEACFCWWAPWTCVQSTDSHYSSNSTLPASKHWKNWGFGPGIADRNLKASYPAAKADVKWTSPCPWGYLTLPEPLDLAYLAKLSTFLLFSGVSSVSSSFTSISSSWHVEESRSGSSVEEKLYTSVTCRCSMRRSMGKPTKAECFMMSS